MPSSIPLLIDGKLAASRSRRKIPVLCPATQKTLALAPCAAPAEIDRAVAGAKRAFAEWRDTPAPARARVMFEFQRLLKQNHDRLARVVAEDNGKTYEDARGDVWRGIEVVEQACAVPAATLGDSLANLARGVDTVSYAAPLGVVAGVTPFNFPAMIPLWMFPLAVACGNTFVLKPSEQAPLAAMELGKLFLQAGAPAGVLQIVHGDAAAVDQILAHPDIRAVSFVGSVAVGQHIYKTAAANFKRVQALAGAKNHLVVMPDANCAETAAALAGASCGAAGQRCMAISVAVFVGESKKCLPAVAAQMKKMKPGHWRDKNAAFGPLISPTARARVLDLIRVGKAEGARALLDGSNCKVPGYPRGNWVGPTLFTEVDPSMRIYREEIFGPALLCLEARSLEEAISIVNADPRGNGAAIFTASGAAAREFSLRIESGQVGINVPIPVPLPMFSFTGWKQSFYGDLHAYGKHAVRFYTETKTVTSRWFADGVKAAESKRYLTRVGA